MKSGFYDRSYLLRHELGNHTDVVIDNPQNNDVIQYDSTLGVFRNSPVEAAELGPASDVRDYLEVYSETEVNDLISAITPTTQLYDGGPDLPYTDVDAFLDDVNVYSDLDVDSLLAGKQATLTGTSDVPGLDTALAGKSDTGHGHALTDSAITGVLPASKGGLGFDASSLGVSSAEFGYLDGVTSPIQTQLDALVTALGGKQAAASALTNLVALAASIGEGQAVVGDGSGGYEAADIGGGAPVLEIDSATDWGNGSDGAVTYSSNTTLTSDVQATTLVVNSGVTVSVGWNSAAGRPALIRATTSITVDGTISARGSDGGPGSSGNPGAGGASLTGGGGGGGARSAGTPLGAAGTSGRPSSNGSAGSTGYVGGAGGPGDMATGGVGGATSGGTVPGAGGSASPSMTDTLVSPADLWVSRGGSGGGGGSANTSNYTVGAGGGGGGGTVLLASPVITISSTGSIDARGGAGGVGFSMSSPDGGGGGGGSVVLLTEDLTIRGAILVTGGAVDTVSGTGAVAGADGSILIAATYPVQTGLSATIIPAKVVS